MTISETQNMYLVIKLNILFNPIKFWQNLQKAEPERPSSGKPENSSKETGELRLLFDVSFWDISVVVIEDKPFPPLPQLENLMRLLPLFTDL
ncbi:BnaA01g05790D [Brassica napus]|uniref:(rape) hypothetical protein n=1 Tax=Brassica napus TaxID=3708 RepID=A0A078GNY4_BRANA|nr:unnamed protein product [Brassica napus]CDY28270.1 BnaA01g05790D [Brassica napus]